MGKQTTLYIKKNTLGKFQVLKKRLGFSTNDEFLNVLLRLIRTVGWSKAQLYHMSEPPVARTKTPDEPYIPDSMSMPTSKETFEYKEDLGEK